MQQRIKFVLQIFILYPDIINKTQFIRNYSKEHVHFKEVNILNKCRLMNKRKDLEKTSFTFTKLGKNS